MFDNENRAHAVGQKRPNAFGVYDMLGNVWEWTHDSYGADYYQQSPAVDPPGPPSASSTRFAVVLEHESNGDAAL